MAQNKPRKSRFVPSQDSLGSNFDEYEDEGLWTMYHEVIRLPKVGRRYLFQNKVSLIYAGRTIVDVFESEREVDTLLRSYIQIDINTSLQRGVPKHNSDIVYCLP